MAILLVSETTEQTDAQYDKAVRRVQAAGQWPPAGCQVHIAARKGNGYLVVTVWDSQEVLDEFFSETLNEALQQAGVTLGETYTLEIRDLAIASPNPALTA